MEKGMTMPKTDVITYQPLREYPTFNPYATCCPMWPDYLAVQAALHGWTPRRIEILTYREGSKLRGPHARMVNPEYLPEMLADPNLHITKAL